jgi:hypothetical protein
VKSDKNEAARDLWDQIFARLAADEYAAIVDPDHNDDADERRVHDGMAEAGWSAEEIESRVRTARTSRSGQAETSPGVAPNIERQLNLLCDDVEAAMGRLGLSSHVHLARGVEPVVTTPGAAMVNVIMTDQAIITVTSFFFRFCGLVARAFTRTLHIDPRIWDSPDYSEESALALLRSSPVVGQYWLSIFLSYALTGTNVLTPYRPARRHELILFEQVARAMELFALAHEYGHHHLAHGRDIDVDPKRQEFEADLYAIKICHEIERQPLLVANPYLSSGAGGVVLLAALEILRGTTRCITHETPPQSDSHPTVAERLARLDAAVVPSEPEFRVFQNFRLASQRLMHVVGLMVNQALGALTPSMIAELQRATRQATPRPP